MRVKPVLHEDGSPYGVRFDCPGCGQCHVIPTHGPKAWGFNGSLALPTLTPSILVYAGYEQPRCHSFVTDGRIQFCGDSEHALAGQTVDLPEIQETA